MNFLAHLHLAEPNPSSRTGNLLGDFVKGLPWDDRFSDEIWQGIMEHRHLDVFTDQHPAWRTSRERLQPENRRFAGIIIDVFYDYFLAKHWQTFQPGQTLEAFVDEVHRDLKSMNSCVPWKTRCVFRRLIRQKWLLGYGEMAGVAITLQRVANASPKLKQVEGLESELSGNKDGFEADFLAFYPDAVAQAELLRREIIPELKKKHGK